ncbi:MAG: hypothetical protein ACOYKZ_07500 [Chlamydiia bacterium]
MILINHIANAQATYNLLVNGGLEPAGRISARSGFQSESAITIQACCLGSLLGLTVGMLFSFPAAIGVALSAVMVNDWRRRRSIEQYRGQLGVAHAIVYGMTHRGLAPRQLAEMLRRLGGQELAQCALRNEGTWTSYSCSRAPGYGIVTWQIGQLVIARVVTRETVALVCGQLMARGRYRLVDAVAKQRIERRLEHAVARAADLHQEPAIEADRLQRHLVGIQADVDTLECIEHAIEQLFVGHAEDEAETRCLEQFRNELERALDHKVSAPRLFNGRWADL